MSKLALELQKIRDGLKDVLLGSGQLYEGLREQGNAESSEE
jgi:type I restriction enzyme R subunit